MKKELRNKLLKFRDERNWKEYHTPKELSRALMIEAGELNKLFLWDDRFYGNIGIKKEAIEDEIADIAIYLEYLLCSLSIDVDKAVEMKIMKNEKKYPIS